MKLLKLALTTVLAVAGMSFFQPANAQNMVPLPQDGDIFMGFHSAGAANEYLVDLGSYTQFINQPVGFHLSLGNFGVDLSTVFGTNWATDNTIQWGAAGTLDASSNLFATKAEPAIGQFATPWGRRSTSQQTVTGSTIDTMAFGDYAGQFATPNNPRGVIHSKNSGFGVSWTENNSGGSSFQTWVPTIEAPILPGNGTGIPGTRLDLFQLIPDNTGTQPPGSYLGTFSIDSSGNVSFDVLSAVPEPSTYASVIAGALLLIVMLRFRSRALKA